MSRERMILEHRSAEHLLSLIEPPTEGLPPCTRCRRWRRRLGVVLLVLFIGFCFWLVGYLDKQTQDLEAAQYCEMHALWIESKGDVGWPDFRGTYAKECLHEAAQ